jgi:hypothetical protein
MMNQSNWRRGENWRHDAHPGDPSSTSRGFASYAQEAVTIGRSLIAEGERQDGDFRLPTLRQPRDAVEKQTPFLLVTPANHESGRGTFGLSGPLASVLIAHQPNTPPSAGIATESAKSSKASVVAKSNISSLRPRRTNASSL